VRLNVETFKKRAVRVSLLSLPRDVVNSRGYYVREVCVARDLMTVSGRLFNRRDHISTGFAEVTFDLSAKKEAGEPGA